MTTTPRTPDISVGRHALLARAFETFGVAMAGFVEQQMVEYMGDDETTPWNLVAAGKLGRTDSSGVTDPLFQLLVMRRFWGPAFADFFKEDLRPLIGQLVEARNLWAHFNLPSESAYSDRLLLAMERIVAPVAPEVTSELRALRAELHDPEAGDGDISVEVSVSPDAVGLVAQLRKTEAAFEELQRQYGELTDQLTATRRAAAGKQLKLTAAENLADTMTKQTERLEARLAAELMSRNRMEWLFVAFITLMVLVMTLISL
ncbi:MAG: Swt1 family HEPN domain-containing protein [Acidimicrobiales bacterium]